MKRHPARRYHLPTRARVVRVGDIKEGSYVATEYMPELDLNAGEIIFLSKFGNTYYFNDDSKSLQDSTVDEAVIAGWLDTGRLVKWRFGIIEEMAKAKEETTMKSNKRITQKRTNPVLAQRNRQATRALRIKAILRRAKRKATRGLAYPKPPIFTFDPNYVEMYDDFVIPSGSRGQWVYGSSDKMRNVFLFNLPDGSVIYTTPEIEWQDAFDTDGEVLEDMSEVAQWNIGGLTTTVKDIFVDNMALVGFQGIELGDPSWIDDNTIIVPVPEQDVELRYDLDYFIETFGEGALPAQRSKRAKRVARNNRLGRKPQLALPAPGRRFVRADDTLTRRDAADLLNLALEAVVRTGEEDGYPPDMGINLYDELTMYSPELLDDLNISNEGLIQQLVDFGFVTSNGPSTAYVTEDGLLNTDYDLEDDIITARSARPASRRKSARRRMVRAGDDVVDQVLAHQMINHVLGGIANMNEDDGTQIGAEYNLYNDLIDAASVLLQGQDTSNESLIEQMVAYDYITTDGPETAYVSDFIIIHDSASDYFADDQNGGAITVR